MYSRINAKKKSPAAHFSHIKGVTERAVGAKILVLTRATGVKMMSLKGAAGEILGYMLVEKWLIFAPQAKNLSVSDTFKLANLVKLIVFVKLTDFLN